MAIGYRKTRMGEIQIQKKKKGVGSGIQFFIRYG